MPVHTLLRALAVLTVSALAVLGTAGPSLAGYGPESGDATVSATVVEQGEPVTVSGDGFCPDSTVTVTVRRSGSVQDSFTAEADGQGDVTVQVTPERPGRYSVRLAGQSDACDGTQRVLGVKFGARAQAAAGAQGPSNLPRSGGVDFTPLWAGLGLLVAGGMLLTVSRGRRRVTV